MSETIKGISIDGLSPEFVARRHYQEGGGHDNNPYRPDSDAHEKYKWEMHRLYRDEGKRLEEEIRGGL